MNEEDIQLFTRLNVEGLNPVERLDALAEAVQKIQTFTSCCICFEEVPDQELFELPCGHGGCDDCMLTHLNSPLLEGQQVKQCPMCRTNIDSSFLSLGDDVTSELAGLAILEITPIRSTRRRTCTSQPRRTTRNRRVLPVDEEPHVVVAAAEELPVPHVVVAATAAAEEPPVRISPLARRYRARNQVIIENNNSSAANLQDLYETMERDIIPLIKLIQELAPRCFITDDNNRILEPCCGNGAISNVFKILGYKVIERDFYTRQEKHDFLTDNFPEDPFDFIVTNPPYNGKKKFLLRALESGKPFAMFLPVDILFMSNMSVIFEGHRVLVYSPNKKAMFLRNGEYKNVGDVVWIVVDFPNIQEGITVKYYSY